MKKSDIDRLAECRRRLKSSRSMISRRLQVSEASLYRWEKGICKPLPIFKKKLERLLVSLTKGGCMVDK